MDLGIAGRLGVVTGASRGIGQGIAEALAEEGVTLVLVARNHDALCKARSKLNGNSTHHVLAMDLLESDAPARLCQEIEKIGVPDILVHNVGGSAGVQGMFASVAEWQKVWQLNVGLGISLNNLLVPKMRERGWGRIVHLSTLSTATYQGNPAYVSAKCALDGYVKSLSREVSKDGIIVSSVAPGAVSLAGRYFSTLEQDPEAVEKYYDQHLPIRRFGKAKDIAEVVAFLCSNSAGYMAGSRVEVDGGWI